MCVFTFEGGGPGLKVLQQVGLRLLGLDGDSGWEARSFLGGLVFDGRKGGPDLGPDLIWLPQVAQKPRRVALGSTYKGYKVGI